jgi:PAS domain S-box-containing protein
MSCSEFTKVLLVEDDPDDYVIIRDYLSEVRSAQFTLDWAKSYDEGLREMVRNSYEVVLLDYRLGAENGLTLLRTAIERGCQSPIILLSGVGHHEVDVEAMEAGASDYLVKGKIQSDSLERSLRYAMQRKRAAATAAFEQARLAAFGAEIGYAVSAGEKLPAILERCSQALTRYLNSSLGQIFIFDSQKNSFCLRAQAGDALQKSRFGPASTSLMLSLDSRELSEGKSVLIRDLQRDERARNPEYFKTLGLASCAACPLILGNKLVGLMVIFSPQPFPEQVTQEMDSVASNIALCIERNRSEEALGETQGKYRAVVENIKEVIFQLDDFGNWIFLNPAWKTVTGFDEQGTLGSGFLDYLHAEEREQSRQIFLKLIDRSLEYARYETRLITKEGAHRWIEFYSHRVEAADGSISISGTLSDITERKAAETQIQKLAAFPRVNPNPVLEFSAEGQLSYANEAAWELVRSLGLADISAVLPANTQAVIRECFASGEKKLREEISLSGRTIAWSFFPIPSSRVVHCYGADVTDMLNLEAQFRHAQKLESVGQLAAGVAHDFNNILTVIMGYSDTLAGRPDLSADVREPLKLIAEASGRAASLTRQLLMFSRKQVVQLKSLELNMVLQNLDKMLSRLLGEDIVLQTHYGAPLPRIEADTGMLEQVVMNLTVNSRDAMPKGGTLKISTSVARIDSAYVSRNADSRLGTFACLTIRDSGTGMDRKTQERIFEPFFSTKEVGKGTGLGLATVYGIVKQHEGWIEVESAPGQGTTFRIFFPEASEMLSRSAPAAEKLEVTGGRETILVVEDEEVLRELVREILLQYDYQVIEAGSAVEALRVWDAHEGRIDLLLTDMVMPEGMSGKDLAAQLQGRAPELKVIYTSGYSPEVMGTEIERGQSLFLPKPYLPPQLAQIVRLSLDSRPREMAQAV